MSSSENPSTTVGANSTSAPNPITTNANPGFNPTQSSTLYLFTFLATLLLLLAVSCAIVIRSFILRRRFRRRIEEAIAAGVLIPGALDDTTIGGMGRSRRRDFGEKPKLWEVWIDGSGYLDQMDRFRRDSLGKNEGKWENIMPISAAMLPLGTAAANTPAANGDLSIPSVGSPNSTLQDFLSRFFGRYTGSASLDSVRNNISEDDISSAAVELKEQCPDNDRLQVAVLITMPNPNSPEWENNDSPKGKARGLNTPENIRGIPDVVFGVTDVIYRM